MNANRSRDSTARNRAPGDQVGLMSFQAMSGNAIIGPRSGAAPPAPSAPQAAGDVPVAADGPAAGADADSDLDAFLAGFGDGGNAGEQAGDDDIGAALAALLDDLR